MADLARFEGLVRPSERHYFRQRLTHGRRCFLALDNNNLAAYCWATTQVEFEIDNLEISLQPGDAYLDDAYTVPAYRRLGIQSALHVYRLRYLLNIGCRRAVLIVRTTNTASQNLVGKLGYHQVDRLSFRRLLWKRSYHYRQRRF
jgi:ribosomal protein S18 acetylase RimI-like enzyme